MDENLEGRARKNLSDDLGGRQRKDERYETIIFAAVIAIVAFAGESLAHKRLMSDLPILPLVAALQLVAGLHLGPRRGTIAAVLGGFAASLFFCGNHGLVPILVNPSFAGGAVNSVLPSVLLMLLRMAGHPESALPELYASRKRAHNTGKAFLISSVLLAGIILVALLSDHAGEENLIYLASLFLLLIGWAVTFLLVTEKKKQRLLLLGIIAAGSLVGSLIWSVASTSHYNRWIVDAGVPWFLWEAIYSILTLQLLNILKLDAERAHTRKEGSKTNIIWSKLSESAYYHAVVYSVCICYFVWVWFHPDPVYHGADLHSYLLAAHGDYSGYHIDASRVIHFIYPHFTAVIWKPLLLLDFVTAYKIIYIIGCLSYLWMTRKLLTKDLGGLIAIVGLKAVDQIDPGNIYPLLAVLATNPLGIIVASLFKFPIAGIGLILFLVRYRAHTRECP
jgi:hypothetical protein